MTAPTLRRLAAVALAVGVGVALLVTHATPRPTVRVPAPAAAGSGCTLPATGPAAPPSEPVAPPAAVSVPGATSIDLRGLVPGAVTETPDGQAWVAATDPRATTPEALVARVGPGATTASSVTPIAEGCDVTAIAALGPSVWVATCDPTAAGTATSGAELVRLDASGAVTTRVAVPAGCVTQLAAGTTTLWASTAPRSDAPPRLFRLTAATGVLDAPVALNGEQPSGLAVAGDDPWTVRTAASGSRLVRNDGATGAGAVAVATGPARLAGVLGRTLWTSDPTTGALTARDATTGAAITSVPVPTLQAVAVGASGVWYEQASTASLTVTIGRLAAGGTPTTVTSFTGPGPAETGLPFLGTLSVTARGAWLAEQDHLFVLPA